MTGFFIPGSDDSNTAGIAPGQPERDQPGNAETDGPLGTFVLADVLSRLGIPTTVITDELCRRVVQAGCTDQTRNSVELLVSPIDRANAASWRNDILQRTPARQISHFIAIERVGPGYPFSQPPVNRSELSSDQSPADSRSEWLPGHCCNMRGESIDAFSADLHLLIEDAKTQNSAIKVIGIGDGGNEIGMGRFPREELLARISGPNADRIPCRISADATIVAGISNWGAYALAAAVAVHYDRVDLLKPHTADSQWQLVKRITEEAGAVDGVTRRNEPTVDGLPFLTQIQPWIAIREQLGLLP